MTEGYQLQQWVFVERLGEGGMAEVWKARHVHLDEFAAIKFLLPQFAASPEVQERFLREGRSQFQLRHPNIVKSSDFITHEGQNFLVMEYIEGQSLDDLVLQGALPLDRVLELALPLLDALGHAHEHGIVHRDVKPTNVLLDLAGKPYLSDFGIAKALQPSGSGSARKTTGTTLMGSVHYMSPEQIRRPADVDARGDIYSFGCVLYETLTGRPPFDYGEGDAQTDFDVVNRQVFEAPRPLRQLNPAVPERIEAAVLRALNKERSRRFSSCKAMARALQQATSKRVDTVIENGADETSSTPGGRNRIETIIDTAGKEETRSPRPMPWTQRIGLRAVAMVFVGALLAGAGYLAILAEREPVTPPANPPGQDAPAVDPPQPPSDGTPAAVPPDPNPPPVNPPPGNSSPVNPPSPGADESRLQQLRQTLLQMQGDDTRLQQLRQSLEADLRNQQRDAAQAAARLRAAETRFMQVEATAAGLQERIGRARQSAERSGDPSGLAGPADAVEKDLLALREQEALLASQHGSEETALRARQTASAQLAERLIQAETDHRNRAAEAARLAGQFSGAGGAWKTSQAEADQLARDGNQHADSLRGLYAQAIALSQRPPEADSAQRQRTAADGRISGAEGALQDARDWLSSGVGPTPPPRGSFDWRLNLRQNQTALIRFRKDGQSEYVDGALLGGQGLRGVQADVRLSSDTFEVTQPLLPNTGFLQLELKCKKRRCNETVTVTWTRN